MVMYRLINLIPTNCNLTGIPFFKETLNKKNKPKRKFYRKKLNKNFSTPVSKNLFIRDSYKNRNKKIVNKTVVTKKTKAKKNLQTQTTSLLNSSKTYNKTLLG